jgi:hypothetical protein
MEEKKVVGFNEHIEKYKVEIDAHSICIKECLPRSVLYHQVFKSPLPYFAYT